MATYPIASFFPGLRVLVVEDLVTLAIQYQTLAARLKVEVITAGTVAQALRQVGQGPWHAALVDLNLPDGSGFEVLQALLKTQPACSVVVITAEDSLDNAVRASEAGAFDFIEKPVEAERLMVTLRNALHASQLSQKVASLETGAPQQFEQFIGQSAEMQTVYRVIETVAASNAPVCITGESGTGKELAALAIHTRSPRRDRKLVTINCAAIPKELIESELFGHAKGAFTGAVSDRQGVFIEADRGTVFLDEIAELELGVQAKLLRVLQTGEVKRLGEDKTRMVDVRVVCASHRNLPQQMRDGAFREDLFYRLYVIPLELPPLRVRGEDIVLIARDFLAKYAREDHKQFVDFSGDALDALRQHSWPGNVRELLNVIRAVVAMNDDTLVQLPMLPAGMRRGLTGSLSEVAVVSPRDGVQAAPDTMATEPEPWFAQAAAVAAPDHVPPVAAIAFRPTATMVPAYDPAQVRPLADVEREQVDYALRAFAGNVARAARALKVNPSTLYRKIQVWMADGSLAPEALS